MDADEGNREGRRARVGLWLATAGSIAAAATGWSLGESGHAKLAFVVAGVLSGIATMAALWLVIRGAVRSAVAAELGAIATELARTREQLDAQASKRAPDAERR
jgi:hypothetical protein